MHLIQLDQIVNGVPNPKIRFNSTFVQLFLKNTIANEMFPNNTSQENNSISKVRIC